MRKKINKKELKERCRKLVTGSGTRNVQRFSSQAIFEVLKDVGFINLAPRLKYTYHQNRGYGLLRVFRKYLEFLIDESLKYPIDIYIPKIGLLKIREIESVGAPRSWMENGVFKQRLDTPFNKSVMYRIYHNIFGVENTSFLTPFRLNRRFASTIIGRIYKLHPEGGYYDKYIKNKA